MSWSPNLKCPYLKNKSNLKNLKPFQLVRDREAAAAGAEDQHQVFRDREAARRHQAERPHVASHRHRQHHQRGAGKRSAQVRSHFYEVRLLDWSFTFSE